MRTAEGGDEPRGRSPWAYAGLGLEIVVPILLGLYIGYRVDMWLGTRPWLFLVGALAGMVMGFYTFIKRVLPAGKDGEGRPT